MSYPKTVSKEDLIKAHQVSAKLVVRYGTDFVPAFERMELELERLEELGEAVARAEREVRVWTER